MTDVDTIVLHRQLAEIAGQLEGSAQRSEELRRLDPAAEAALRSTDLFRLWWPAELGGVNATVAEGIELIEAITAIDTAAAWNVAVCTLGSGFAAAYLDDHAIEEIFGTNLTLIAGQTAPVGTAVPEGDDLIVSGNWTFGSGIHLSSWAKAGVVIERDGRSEPALVVVPIDAVEIDETSWNVAGLAGSGSCDYTMSDVRVPEGYWYDYPLANRQRGGVTYELPLPAQVVILHAGFALGAAQRALTEITELAATKVRQNDTSTISNRPRFQFELSEHDARLAGARLHVYECARRLQETAGTSEFLGPMRRLRASTRYVNDVALEVATWAYRNAGGTALHLHHPLQRVLRDMLAATQHVFVDDRAHTDNGASLVGLEPGPRPGL